MSTVRIAIKSVLAAAIGIAVAAPSRAADEAAAPEGPTRDQVNAEVIAARADGTLQPAGDFDWPVVTAPAGISRSRDAVKQEVLEARANGSLIAAGEGDGAGPVDVPYAMRPAGTLFAGVSR
ncbi:DUF4148 domain-containing protein [Piscinibacter koreensis]|uniref:DUF4148 domain-containing protein n=1 Tax=Piscinibacter koreensis TaxID=2742824 RepID=A0A7Y6TWF4_9BURK|nr:DUF4148 domain-containing protein [Schlegelella koreensis]NUZ05957.1 DUF4148 domain-containing protein [Schlegelella koreensis]